MANQKQNRRRFLQTSGAAAAAVTVPYFFSTRAIADDQQAESANDRPTLGCIGTGSRWGSVGPSAMNYANCVAVCDVDANHAANAANVVQKHQQQSGKAPDIYEDYRKVLERKDIDIVTIVTTDHWHSKIAIEAMQAGKDVYCEKPLTLTIEEGKLIGKVQQETGRVFQVGTQQRTEMGQRFLHAIAMIRDGRIGDVQKITCDIGGAPMSSAIPVADVPSGLNWEKWLGQAPLVDYRYGKEGNQPKTRCHYEFRWWYEYSGGKLTDWGAHHVDIAQWAIGQNGPGQGVVSVEPVEVHHPVDFKDGRPVQDDRYNTADKFVIKCMFPGGVEFNIVSNSSDGIGILFEGTKGRFHVSRGNTKGKPFEDLKEMPLPENAIAQVYGGKQPTNHMANFIECVKTRELPISDVHTHHRALTTCHLSNIAIRLGRALKWDSQAEQIVGDDDANAWQSRKQRPGYEINV
ncbi:MAG: Gfo/Idh/MocA family oxidoreductase [Planctomycetota bacterium]|nr:Gfo/Idh/MocA family oxidoreductase [Planctomycetota bacterium]